MNIIATDRQLPIRIDHLYPVILCGGAGKRLWPLSRSSYPKQFLSLVSERSLLQDTAERACGGLGLGQPVVVCNQEHRFLVSEQLTAIGRGAATILCEPVGRNTAPALGAAAAFLVEQDPNAVMLAMPSDHYIGDVAAFADAVSRAAALARTGRLVTFGIRPSRPETGYGYIQRGQPMPGVGDSYAVARFIEKPRMEIAEDLIADGSYYWNSGIFVLPAAVYLEELQKHDPETAAACTAALGKGQRQDNCVQLDQAAFAASPEISIDYAVMEKTDRAAVVTCDLAWSDIGSWHSLHETQQADDQGNVLHGNVIADDLENSYIRGNGRMVAAIGLRDIVIVDTDDAVLVTDRAHAKEVGRLVERLQADKRPESTHHTRVYRPWGYYESIDQSSRFQVKHIMVKPGAQLSLQMHHHRHEHWVVVSGTGRVTCGDNVQLLGENGSAFIPLGTTHRLENPGKLPLHLIEVQVGAYLGEDDIVRFQDEYGRA
jgi:mannose-1-phosphate guanylyltransferase/mannose-6-phosphate isomerase